MRGNFERKFIEIMRKNMEHLSLSINFKRNKLCKIMRINRETLIARKT